MTSREHLRSSSSNLSRAKRGVIASCNNLLPFWSATLRNSLRWPTNLSIIIITVVALHEGLHFSHRIYGDYGISYFSIYNICNISTVSDVSAKVGKTHKLCDDNNCANNGVCIEHLEYGIQQCRSVAHFPVLCLYFIVNNL